MPVLMRRRLFASLAAGLTVSHLAGCGFALRQAPRLRFKSIYLALPANSPLGAPLQRALAQNPDLLILSEARDMQSAEVILDILNELREKVVVGRNAAGQVREFQLRLHVSFRLRTPQGRELIAATELLLHRDISFSESVALAKEEEETLLYRDMRADVVQQILRRLAVVPGQ